jgi:hypothetical protein
MGGCTDYWCECYEKGGENCTQCEEKDNVTDKPALRVILKRRADEQMELAQNRGKSKGQER